MRLYRSMQEASDGYPAAGASGRLLGVRPGSDSTPDVLAIDPGDPMRPGEGGMSVAPDEPLDLPRHRRPVRLGGTGRDPVWYIETDDLEPDLEFRQDRPGHGLIEPKRVMTLQEFQDALTNTRCKWTLHCR
jgi:hypothetical protein